MRSHGQVVLEIDARDRFASRLRTGDESILEDIQRELCPALRAPLSWKCRGLLAPDRIEEVLNTALERLWKHRDRFDETKGTLQGYLGRIAENAALDLLRSGWCREMLREGSLDDPSLVGCADEFAEESEDEDSGEAVEPEIQDERLRVFCEALAGLSERQRRIVLDMEHSSSELAEDLGICPSTVRRHRQDSLQILRTALERYERKSCPPREIRCNGYIRALNGISYYRMRVKTFSRSLTLSSSFSTGSEPVLPYFCQAGRVLLITKLTRRSC